MHFFHGCSSWFSICILNDLWNKLENLGNVKLALPQPRGGKIEWPADPVFFILASTYLFDLLFLEKKTWNWGLDCVPFFRQTFLLTLTRWWRKQTTFLLKREWFCQFQPKSFQVSTLKQLSIDRKVFKTEACKGPSSFLGSVCSNF
jgi:hypothetical protein